MLFVNTPEQLIAPEDKNGLSYFECCMDNTRGILVPNDLGLKFIQSGLEAQNQKPLEIKFDMIEEISWSADDHLFIAVKNSKRKRKIESMDTSLQLLEEIIKSGLRSKVPADDYCSYSNHILKYE